MHKLGISVYPDKTPMNEVYAYMEKAAKLGFSRIFTCFLSIPDDERESYLVQFKDCVFDLDSDLDEMLGAYSLVYGKFGHENIIAKVSVREVVKSGEKIKACFDNSKLHFFDVDTTRRIRAEEYVGLPKEEGDEE